MDTQTASVSPLHTYAAPRKPRVTVSVTRRPWTASERDQLARILFGPHPADEE